MSCYVTDLYIVVVVFYTSKEKKRRAAEGQNAAAGEGAEESKEERVITLRALNMEDFKQAKSQVKNTKSLEKRRRNSPKDDLVFLTCCWFWCRLQQVLQQKDQ